MTDIIDSITQAIGCQQCGNPLGDSPSWDFCREACFEAWHAARAHEPAETVDLVAVFGLIEEVERRMVEREAPLVQRIEEQQRRFGEAWAGVFRELNESEIQWRQLSLPDLEGLREAPNLLGFHTEEGGVAVRATVDHVEATAGGTVLHLTTYPIDPE